MKSKNFALTAEIPGEWKFATKFASDCECDGLVHSGLDPLKNAPKSQLKCPKNPFLGILIPQNDLFGHFNRLLGSIFSGGPNWHLSCEVSVLLTLQKPRKKSDSGPHF